MAEQKKRTADKVFPEIDVIRDSAVMQKIFQSKLPDFAGGKWQITKVNVRNFQHKRGKRCTVNYGIHFKNAVTGKPGKQLYFARVLGKGKAEAKFAEAQRQSYIQLQVGPAIHFLPELEMILWGYPNDPKHLYLDCLSDPSKLRKILLENWEFLHVPASYSLAGLKTQIVKYVRQERCTLEHRLLLQNTDKTGDSELTIFSKIYTSKRDGATIFNLSQRIWNAEVCQSGELIVPEPLFYDRNINTMFHRGLPGQNLGDLLGEIDLDKIVEKIGSALAGFHQAALPTLYSRSREAELLDFAEGMESLCEFNPDFQSPLEAISVALEKRFSGLPQLEPVALHGAFRLTQFLLVDGKIALLDFDGILKGDPIADVSCFISHLLYFVIKGKITEAQSRSAIHHFCRAYAEKAPWGLPPEVLDWYTAVMLIGKHGKKSFKLMAKYPTAKVDQLMGFASAILQDHFLDSVTI